MKLTIKENDNHPGGPVALECDNSPVLAAPDDAELPLDAGSVTRIETGRLLVNRPAAARAALLRECRRILAPGGLLVATVPRGDVEAVLELSRLAGLDREVGADVEGAGEESILELVKTTPQEVIGRDPLVSILIAAYAPAYFEEALTSALSQTYAKIEIVVADDCPTDAVEKIVRRCAGDDSRVRYYRNEQRLGGRRNYIELFGTARGEYIKYLNDDDLLHPECVETMARCLAGHPDVTLVTSHRRVIDAEGNELPEIPATVRPVSTDSVIDGVSLVNDMLSRQVNFIGEPTTVMFRKSDAAGIRPHLLSFAGRPSAGNGDVTLWVNLLNRGNAIYLTRSLSSFRQHGNQRQRDPEAVARGRRGWRQLCFDARATGFLRPRGGRVLRAEPLDLKPWWPAGVRSLLTTCNEQVGRGDLSGAASTLHAALASVPEDPELRVLEAKLLTHAGKTEQANATLARAARTGSHLPALHAGYAMTLIDRGDLETAEAAMWKALSLDPYDETARKTLAMVACRRRPDLRDLVLDRVVGGLNHPAPGQEIRESLWVTGWVLAGPDEEWSFPTLEITVDGRPIEARIVRVRRPDVAGLCPELALLEPTPGFEAAVTTADFRTGPHEIVCAVRRGSRVIEIARSRITIVNEPYEAAVRLGRSA